MPRLFPALFTAAVCDECSLKPVQVPAFRIELLLLTRDRYCYRHAALDEYAAVNQHNELPVQLR